MHLEYPPGFPSERQTRVEIENLRATKEFGLTEDRTDMALPELEQRALKWLCRVLGVFADQACELGEAKLWTVMQIEDAVHEFREQLVRRGHFKISDGRFNWVDQVFGAYIRPAIGQQIERSAEWRSFQDRLLEVADAQVGNQVTQTEDKEGKAKHELTGADPGEAAGRAADVPHAGMRDGAPVSVAAPGTGSRHGTRAGKRLPSRSRYSTIDKMLISISEAKPKKHEEVFRFLDERHVRIPQAEPFESSGGWRAGLRSDPQAAHAWLSKRWSLLELPGFPRGPK